MQKFHTLYGRVFAIVAEFADTDEGAKEANRFMESHEGIGVLEVIDGRVILADCADKGIPADEFKAPEPASFWIAEDRIAGLDEKVVKYNKRAKKLGVDSIRVISLGERYVRWIRKSNDYYERRDPADAIPPGARDCGIVREVNIRIEGELPKLDGWRFLAAVDHMGAENIIRTFSDSKIPERYRTSGSFCEHCNTRRVRNSTYLVEHVDGRVLQVGKSCLKDFLGHGDAERMAEMAEWKSQMVGYVATEFDPEEEFEEREPAAAGQREQMRYCSLAEFLPFVAAAIRHFGWVSRTEARNSYEEKTSTADLAFYIQMNRNGSFTKEQPADEDDATAERAIAWANAITDEEAAKSEYMRNVRIIGRCGVFHVMKHDGLAAAIVSSYQKDAAKQAEKAAAAGKRPSQWIGEVGKRIAFPALTVLAIHRFENAYGVTHLHKMASEEGDIVVWKSSSGSYAVGDVLMLKATIKDHDLYGSPSIKQTVISRPVQL